MASQNRDDVREFLTSRRAKVRREQVELAHGPNRRVPGLRRTEVALLPGVSVEYYTKLERGDLTGASDTVLHAIANALLLDEAERDHLFHLARATGPAHQRRARRSPRQPVVRPSLQYSLDAITGGPALVRNGRMDIIAANLLGRALYVDAYATQPPGQHRPLRLPHPRQVRAVLPRLEPCRRPDVGILRAEAGRDPHDRDFQDLIGQLSSLSEEFRARWGAHDVRRHDTGVKHFHHSVVGDLHLQFESTDLPADPGWKLQIYTAEPASTTADALNLLASWAATPKQHTPTGDPPSRTTPPTSHPPSQPTSTDTNS